MLNNTDVIHLRGLEFYGFHGVLPEEKVLGQRFVIDLDLYTDFSTAAETDRVETTINYAEVFELVKALVTEERFNLLEALAVEIAQKILRDFTCKAVRVVVHKPQAPIQGIFRDVAVEIFRGKENESL